MLPRTVSPKCWRFIGRAWWWFAKMTSTFSRRCAWGVIVSSHSGWQRPLAQEAVPIAAHGSDASDHVAEYLGAGFDAVLIGEVETTLVELAEGWPRASIRGLAYRELSSVWRNPPRELRADLASLPPAAWDLVDMDQYRQGVEAGARLFLAEHGLQPRLPVPMQLVRQANLTEIAIMLVRPTRWLPRCVI